MTYDRSSFGSSTPQHRRRGHRSDRDALALVRLPVFGVSGGGPHPLPFAAIHPQRITHVAPAPVYADGLDWAAGITRTLQSALDARSQMAGVAR